MADQTLSVSPDGIAGSTYDYQSGTWNLPRLFVDLISEAAHRAGAEVRWLSNEWIARLEKRGRMRFIHGTSFPLNSSAAAAIAADKVSTYTVLSDAGIPAVPHYLIRLPPSGYVKGAGERVLSAIGVPLVVKPTAGAGSLDVYKAETVAEGRALVQRLAARYRSLAVAPFVQVLGEYRVVMLDETPELLYEKRLTDRHEWRHNFKHGAIPVLVDSPAMVAMLSDIAIAAMRALDGRFMCVDVITTETGARIIEINSGVMLSAFAGQSSGYRERALRVYTRAIKRSFDD